MMENKDQQLTIDELDNQNMESVDYSVISEGNVVQNKADMGFKTLVDGFNDWLYVIPKYQRKYIWSKEQVGNLAISLIKGLPIPPIYVYRNNEGRLEILDGQQRMLSLFFYYKGKYIKNSTNTQVELQKIIENNDYEECNFEDVLNKYYPLKDVDYRMQYNKKNTDMNRYEEEDISIKYSTLPKDIRRKIDYTTISIIEIKVDEKERHKVLYKVFENLNEGGTRLTKQELRNGIYSSPFYDMLHELNENEEWRNIYGDKHAHSKDVELLLRFTALGYKFKLENCGFNIDEYSGSYPTLLNDFSEVAIKFDTDMIKQLKNNLEEFIGKFDVSAKPQNLLLESLYLANLYVHGEYIINDKFIKDIQNDDYYKQFVSKSSATRLNVKGRLDYVYKKLSEYARKYQEQNN